MMEELLGVKTDFMFLVYKKEKSETHKVVSWAEAFRTIECYYENKGTEEEITEGKIAVRWIKRMEGNYRELATASGWPLSCLP